jgi:hypothetical protein
VADSSPRRRTLLAALRAGVQGGTTQLRYYLRCIDDLHAMLKERGDWVPLGNADEQKPAQDGTIEAWGRSPDNPVGGWYGLKKGLRGRFGNYVPPVLEARGSPRSNTTPATTGCAQSSSQELAWPMNLFHQVGGRTILETGSQPKTWPNSTLASSVPSSWSPSTARTRRPPANDRR